MYLSLDILLLAGLAYGAPVELSKRLNNGVGVTPAMGFNNWNSGLRKLTRVYLDSTSSPNSLQHPQPPQL
jgi:hypothetical protein